MTEPSFSSAATAQKGSTVVLPSDFQSERTYEPNYHTLTYTFPRRRGRAHVRPRALTPIYGRARNQFQPVPPASALWRDAAEKSTVHLKSYARVIAKTQLINRPSAAVLIPAMSCPTPINAPKKYASTPQNIRRYTVATPDYTHTCRQSITPIIMENGLGVIWGSLGNHLRILVVQLPYNFRKIKVRRSLDEPYIRNNLSKIYNKRMNTGKLQTKQEISTTTYDAWKISPPCELLEKAYCSRQYPYFTECNADDMDWADDGIIDE